MSCYIISPSDKPPVHDINELNYDDGCGSDEFKDIPEE